MVPFFARITSISELSAPKLTFPPSFINFPSGGPFPPSPPGLVPPQSQDFHSDALRPIGHPETVHVRAVRMWYCFCYDVSQLMEVSI